MTIPAPSPSYRHWLPWAGALIGLALLVWVLRQFDLNRFLTTLAGADLFYLALVPAGQALEQLVRAWKWRQILSPLKLIATLRLFGAVMAGYLIASLIPRLGSEPLPAPGSLPEVSN